MHCTAQIVDVWPIGSFLPEHAESTDTAYTAINGGSTAFCKHVGWEAGTEDSTGLFGRMVIIDRTCDLVTPMLSQTVALSASLALYVSGSLTHWLSLLTGL